MAAVDIDGALGSAITASTIGSTNHTLTFNSATGTPGVGDFIVVCATIRGSTGSITTPSGWTAMTGSPFQNGTSNTSRMYLFYRIRQAGDANSVTFTPSAGAANNTFLAQAYYFAGVDPTTPIEVNPVQTDLASSSTTIGAITGVTTTNANALAVCFFHRADDAGTWGSPTNSWVISTATNSKVTSALGTDASMGMANKEMPSAGATGTFTATITSGAAATGMGVVFALKAQTGTGKVQLTAEGGTDEVAPTPQSSADPYMSIIAGNGTVVVDSAWHATYSGGTKSYRLDVSSTTNERFKCNCDIPSTRQYGAFIGKFSTRPSGATRIAALETYSGTDVAQVQMNASGQFRITSDGNGVIVGPSTATETTNNEFRLEWKIDGTNAELRIFVGADLDNDVSSPTETLSSSSFPSLLVGRGMFGTGVAWGGSGGSLWYDNATVQQDTWVNLKGSITTAITAATETDSATGVTRRKTKALGVATETDSAVAVTRRRTYPVGSTTETDTPTGVARRKTRALGVATETDTAVGVAKIDPIRAVVGTATETDTAVGVTRRKTRVLGVATETDTAVGVTKIDPIRGALGVAAETDTATGVARLKTKVPTAATETDAAVGVTRRKTRLLGVATETDTAVGVSVVTSGGGQTVALGTATETDTPTGVTARKTKAVTAATETDTPTGVTRRKTRALGTTAETDTPTGVARRKTRSVGAATSTEAAVAVTRRKTRALGTATETDTAQQVNRAGFIGTALETDTATGVGRVKRKALGTATESEAAVALARKKTLVLGTAVEVDTALGVSGGPKIVALGTAFETDEAQSITVVMVGNRWYFIPPASGRENRVKRSNSPSGRLFSRAAGSPIHWCVMIFDADTTPRVVKTIRPTTEQMEAADYVYLGPRQYEVGTEEHAILATVFPDALVPVGGP